MPNDKPTKKIAADLGGLYEEMLDSYSLEEFIGHFRAELQVKKDFCRRNVPGALSAEKLARLEKVVEEFEEIYRAEKAEAEKMPISRHSAQSVRKLFDEIDDDFQPVSAEPREH